METSKKRAKVDWKGCLLKFMKLVGESSNEWHPELWISYGITELEAKEIIKQYEKEYKK